MIKLVIVDDEKMIREGLASTIDWEEYNIEVVGVAKDGQQALEICREAKPHIVITDIRMPKMNGIELLKSLKNEISQVKVIILSGYDEFSYAQQAIKYGAVDYLIKPIVAEELDKVIKKIQYTFEEDLFGDLSHIKQYQKLERLLEPYFNAIRIGAVDEAILNLVPIIEHLEEENIPLKKYKKIIIYTITNLESLIKSDGYSLTDSGIELYNNMHHILIHLNSRTELVEWINKFTKDLCEWIQSQKEEGGSNRILIKKAMDYMEDHYFEDLTVENVAEVVSLSPNYFSHVFKKTKGESFTDYLNKLRIEASKRYLLENEYKIYEVAYKVGYKDYKYFSSVFKKYSGVSPTKYCELSK